MGAEVPRKPATLAKRGQTAKLAAASRRFLKKVARRFQGQTFALYCSCKTGCVFTRELQELPEATEYESKHSRSTLRADSSTLQWKPSRSDEAERELDAPRTGSARLGADIMSFQKISSDLRSERNNLVEGRHYLVLQKGAPREQGCTFKG